MSVLCVHERFKTVGESDNLHRIHCLRKIIHHFLIRHEFIIDAFEIAQYISILLVPLCIFRNSFLKSFFLFVACAALVLASSYFVVRGMESISDSFGIPDFTLGIFALGLGTSLPELIFGVRSLVVRHSGLSLGNLIGSAALTSTLILGMVAVFSPIEIELNYDFAVVSISMVVVLFLSHLFLRTGSRVNRREGILLLTIYVIFAVLQFLF